MSGHTGAPCGIALIVTVLMAAGSVGCRPRQGRGGHRERPNILLVTIDTLRWDQVGCYGGPEGQTPNLDALAAGGVRCEQAFAQVPLTLPSHATILTGVYPLAHRVRDNTSFVLAQTATTLAEQLHAAGYRTGAFVGAFVLEHRFGLDQGFDTYDDKFSKDPGRTASERRAEQVAAAFRNWLTRQGGGPWFAWVHFYDPHAPYDPPAGYRRGSGKLPLYQGEVRYADAILGQTLAFVRTRSQDRPLIVVAAGDHGESLGDHGEESHCLLVYDATLRVPLIFWAPGRLPAGQVAHGEALLLDIAPTLLGLAGLGAPPQVQGRNLTGQLEDGGTIAPRDSYAESLYGELNLGWSSLRVLRGPRWKYIRATVPELYDLQGDPGELINLAPSRGSQVASLEAELEDLIRTHTAASDPTERATLDPEARQRLASLGYLSGAAVAPAADQELRAPSGPAPAAKVADWVRIQAVVELAQAGRCSEADAELEPLAKGGEIPALAYRYLGECYSRGGRPQLAIAVLQQALRLGGPDLSLHLQLGTAFHELGREDQALTHFQRALDLEPESAEALNNLGNSHMVLGQWQKAQATFERAVKSHPDHASAWNGLGVASFRLKAHQRAIESFRRALKLEPDQPDALYNLANVLELAGHPVEARESYQWFLASAPHAGYQIQIERARRALERLAATSRVQGAQETGR